MTSGEKKTIQERIVVALQKNSSALPEDIVEDLAALKLAGNTESWESCRQILMGFGAIQAAEVAVKLYLSDMGDISLFGGKPHPDTHPVSAIWEGAPVGDGVYCPSNYIINAQGSGAPCVLYDKPGSDRPFQVSHRPIMISRITENIETGDEMSELAFMRHGRWKKQIFPSEDLANSTTICTIGRRVGAPITSANAAEVVKYLQSFEEENEGRIPVSFSTRRMGWHGTKEEPTKYGFMAGTTHIPGPDGTPIEMEPFANDDEIAAIAPCGSHDVWVEEATKMMAFPMMRVALAAVIAPTLIQVLGAPNAIVEWSGRTTSGKSTLLKIAQSCWRASTDILSTWDLTSNAAQATAKVNCDMPLVLDDTNATGSDDKSRQALGRTVYQLFGGKSRGRSDRSGDARGRSVWRTVVLSTGEVPLTELVEAEGAAARVLSFWSSPLGPQSTDTLNLVNGCIDLMSKNYGHAGPMVVKFLAALSPDRVESYRNMYAQVSALVCAENPSPAARRLSHTIALLEVAACVLNHSNTLPGMGSLWGDDDVKAAIHTALGSSSTQANKGLEAWESIQEYAEARDSQWTTWGEDHKKAATGSAPILGWKGPHGYAWIPSALMHVIDHDLKHIDYKASLRRWKSDGALYKCNPDQYKHTCRPMSGRKSVRLIRISSTYGKHVIEAGEDGDDG